MSEATPTPWGDQTRDWRGNESEFDFYIFGDRHESLDEDDDEPSMVSTSVAIVKGNATAGEIPLENAKLICRAVNSHAATLAILTEPLWLVWSNEHRAWWGPGHCDYTWRIEQAGRYTLEEATKICGTRLVERGDGINPPELIQPAPEWLEKRAALIALATGGVA